MNKGSDSAPAHTDIIITKARRAAQVCVQVSADLGICAKRSVVETKKDFYLLIYFSDGSECFWRFKKDFFNKKIKNLIYG